jgi:RNA polymerase sigma-70 factor (ECF subfamily)
MHAWRRLHTVRDPGRIRSWLLSIAANEARQILRSRSRMPVVEIDVSTVSGTVDPAEGIARIDLVNALNRLAPDDRSLLALRYVVGMDAAELGQLMGRSASGTRARLSRLIGRLRRDLGDD